MAKSGLKLEGFEDVVRNFDKLPGQLQKKALRPATRAGAKVIQKDAKRRAHKFSGNNAKYIKVKSLKRSRKSLGAMVQTGTREQLGIPADEKGYYPFSEEYGTKDTPAHPYMRPALATKRGEATKEVGMVLKKKMTQIVTGMKKKR